MKTRLRPLRFLGGMIIAGIGSLGVADAKEAPFYTIPSPDHPPTWYVSASFDKLDQSLRWSSRDQILSLDITYTLQGEWPLHDDPDLYQGFTVHFPAVHLDPASRQLYFASAPGRRTFIGSVEPSFFGRRVVLDRNVAVSAHRRNGVIDAAIIIYPPTRP